MYVPKPFAVEEREVALALLRREPFGILVSAGGGEPVATHVPFVILESEPLKLGLHVAKANPHWRTLENARVLAIFHGAHALVSASWYGEPRRNVPTWDYSAVHCSGRAVLTGSEGTRHILRVMAETLDPAWSLQDADAEYIAQLENGIVGIEIAVESVVATMKLSQNRTEVDAARVADALSHSGRPMDREIAAQIREMRSLEV